MCLTLSFGIHEGIASILSSNAAAYLWRTCEVPAFAAKADDKMLTIAQKLVHLATAARTTFGHVHPFLFRKFSFADDQIFINR